MASSINRDSLLKLLPVVKSPAAHIKLIYDIIYNYGQLGPAQAFYYENKILDETKKDHDLIGQALITSELGEISFTNGNNTEGLKMNFDATKLAEKTGNKEAIGLVLGNLAFCYPDNINLSTLYYKKALQYSQAADDNISICWELSNLSDNYKALHKQALATDYFMRGFALSIQKGVAQAIPEYLREYGVMQTDPKLKIKFFRASLNMPYAQVDGITKSRILTNIAQYFLERGIIDSGLFYAKKSYDAAGSLFISKKIAPALLLARSYEGRNSDSALKYTKIYYTLRDSMYSTVKMQRAQALAFTDQERRREMEQQRLTYKTNLRFYILSVVILFLFLLAFVFWRNNKQNKKANLLLQQQKEQVQTTLHELKVTQNHLIQTEKMASLGELTAGIAHEIQNPLNFVNNFSEVSRELMEELKEELDKGDYDEAKDLSTDVIKNLEKIVHHGKRAGAIVKGMLAHSKTSSGSKEPTDINALADEYMRLSYNGIRAKDKSFSAEIIARFDKNLAKVNVVPQDIGRVLLNLFNNAFYAVNDKKKNASEGYVPEVTVITFFDKGNVVIKVKDNGTGIADAIKDKIMQPFFTTKPTGEGTGLGLSLSYDMVVKGHGGQIEIDSQENDFSIFTVKLPLT